MFEAFFCDISIQSGEIFFVLVVVRFCMQDQYVNHIMNETGVTVLLKGRGSGNTESSHGEGTALLYKNDLIKSRFAMEKILN